MFHENAEEFGLPYDGPPTVRRDGGRGRRRPAASARWCGATPSPSWCCCTAAPRTPTRGTRSPSPSTGRSWPSTCPATATPTAARTGVVRPGSNAARRGHGDPRARARAPGRSSGMSLGGHDRPRARPRSPPSWCGRSSSSTSRPASTSTRPAPSSPSSTGPRASPASTSCWPAPIEFNPTRSESSLRRGILHNAEQREDGTWVWRYARHRTGDAAPGDVRPPDFGVAVGRAVRATPVR